MNDKEANATTATQREILTADEVAEMLQVHVKTLYKLAEARRIPAKKVGKQWRFSRSGLEQFLSVPTPDQIASDKLKR